MSDTSVAQRAALDGITFSTGRIGPVLSGCSHGQDIRVQFLYLYMHCLMHAGGQAWEYISNNMLQQIKVWLKPNFQLFELAWYGR